MNYRTVYSNELYHHGIKGMKWGVRNDKKGYHSTSIRSAIARRQNAKVDKGFQKWKTGAANRDNAISLGKTANEKRLAYEKDKSNKSAKKDFKEANREYKKALSKNTTYRKGTVREEVGKDLSRKYLSEAKKAEKGLKADPNNKQLQKQYSKNMNRHDVERAKARRAQSVAAARSNRKAAIKRSMTITVKAAVASAAIGVGVKVAQKHGNIKITDEQVKRAIKIAKNIMQYV